jgi:glycosyltransferase involved in cell wall biosynthesis
MDGIHVVRIGGTHWLWFWTFVNYLAKWRGRYDVVVAEGFGGSRIPRFAPLYVKEPIITEWHQIHRDLFAVQYPKLLNGPLNLLERVTGWVHRNTRVRAGTEEWRERFISFGFNPDKVFVQGVSIREDWLASSPPPLPATPTILWLGKLRRYKCPDHAIRALPDVIKRVPDAKLILAIRRDDKKYENQLRALVTDLRLYAHVEFRINVSEEEKRDLFRAASVLVVPSTVEGFGIVVLEANASGVPVIASSGVPDGAVRDGFNGLRYEFADIQALSDAIVRVLEDTELHSVLSKNALANVQRYEWSRVGAEFEQVVMAAAKRPELADVAHN